jgi:hypothetical protein
MRVCMNVNTHLHGCIHAYTHTQKDEEIIRLRGQLKTLSMNGTDQWDKIVGDANAECIRLKRENEEWRTRDEQTARRCVYVCMCVCMYIYIYIYMYVCGKR